MRWGCLAVALAGCNFAHGLFSDGTPDAAHDSQDDAAADATPDTRLITGPCYDKWLDDSVQIGTPVDITEINSAGFDRDPFLLPNELTAYVSSARVGTTGGSDVWIATRSAIGGTFSTPIVESNFSSPMDETKLSITANGLVAVVGSSRTGTAGGIDLWMSVRNSPSASWPAPSRTDVMALETTGDEHDPTISADGTHLYYAPTTPAPQHIMVATKQSDGTFTTPVGLPTVNSAGEADPSPTPDERILLFTSNRSGMGDVYYVTRASTSDAFGSPHIVPTINTTGTAEGDPHLSSDGCRIYFGRDLGNDDWDIFVANVQ